MEKDRRQSHYLGVMRPFEGSIVPIVPDGSELVATDNATK